MLSIRGEGTPSNTNQLKNHSNLRSISPVLVCLGYVKTRLAFIARSLAENANKTKSTQYKAYKLMKTTVIIYYLIAEMLAEVFPEQYLVLQFEHQFAQQ